jgi:hypothetical protein
MNQFAGISFRSIVKEDTVVAHAWSLFNPLLPFQISFADQALSR